MRLDVWFRGTLAAVILPGLDALLLQKTKSFVTGATRPYVRYEWAR